MVTCSHERFPPARIICTHPGDYAAVARPLPKQVPQQCRDDTTTGATGPQSDVGGVTDGGLQKVAIKIVGDLLVAKRYLRQLRRVDAAASWRSARMSLWQLGSFSSYNGLSLKSMLVLLQEVFRYMQLHCHPIAQSPSPQSHC